MGFKQKTGKSEEQQQETKTNIELLTASMIWKKFDSFAPLKAYTFGEKTDKEAGMMFHEVSFGGHQTADGPTRIYAHFGRPIVGEKFPAILLLPDINEGFDDELLYYFIDKGYAVLMPDYSGIRYAKGEETRCEQPKWRTAYPQSISYANASEALASGGLDQIDSVSADKTCWFEWTYVALASIEYLKSREDIGKIGIVGIRIGGEIAWKAMLSPDVSCAVPINAAGWRAYKGVSRFSDGTGGNMLNMSDERHRYIAGIESQSYSRITKCPVLMLCAFREYGFDYDRAYDTFMTIKSDEKVIMYSPDSGSCIGPHAIADMDLFLEKYLKGREIYIPSPLSVSLKVQNGVTVAEAELDDRGMPEEAGIFYAEAYEKTKSVFRDWRLAYKIDGKEVKNGKFSCELTPYEGSEMIFVYAYARYINGFTTVSKITCQKAEKCNPHAVKSRTFYAGDGVDCFGVSNYDIYSVGGIFLECDAVPKCVEEYGNIKGAYSVGGLKTYKINSPKFVPDEGALLEFDVYSAKTETLHIAIDVAGENESVQIYGCARRIRGGGKWKRVILKASDFCLLNGEDGESVSLKSFTDGRALSFDCENEENEYAVTNILWI